MLGIDPKATSETIQQAYAKLAQKYYPNNAVTGNAEMFEAINMAYETLSDAQLRATFDKVKGVNQEETGPKFSGLPFFEAIERGAMLRSAILCVLYDRRCTKPTAPSLSMRHIEILVEATEADLNTAIWYLKQRALAVSDDKSSLQITVDGIDYLESRKPSPGDVMPFIKGHAKAPKSQTESVLNTLNRALARSSA